MFSNTLSLVIRYRKNEVFLDVIESVNLLAGASGNVLRSELIFQLPISPVSVHIK